MHYEISALVEKWKQAQNKAKLRAQTVFAPPSLCAFAGVSLVYTCTTANKDQPQLMAQMMLNLLLICAGEPTCTEIYVQPLLHIPTPFENSLELDLNWLIWIRIQM